MSWTETTRRRYRRDGLRFASDTTDAEWALLKPFMPEPVGIITRKKPSLFEVPYSLRSQPAIEDKEAANGGGLIRICDFT